MARAGRGPTGFGAFCFLCSACTRDGDTGGSPAVSRAISRITCARGSRSSRSWVSATRHLAESTTRWISLEHFRSSLHSTSIRSSGAPSTTKPYARASSKARGCTCSVASPTGEPALGDRSPRLRSWNQRIVNRERRPSKTGRSHAVAEARSNQAGPDVFESPPRKRCKCGVIALRGRVTHTDEGRPSLAARRSMASLQACTELQ